MLVLLNFVFWPSRLAAQDDVRLTAQKLIDATVTVRVAGAQDFVVAAGPRNPKDVAPAAPAENEVTVCSGTYVGENRLLSFGCLPVVHENERIQTEYRITLPAGGQATARPCVVDHNSGLVLLEFEAQIPAELAPLELAPGVPETGSMALTAAASGVEEPLVSLGVLSGVDRILPGTDLPPLLVCDISTTAASSGAAVVDRDARLIGIIAAASLPGESFGWSYAIPLKHIRRVLHAQEDNRLVQLVRMRPTLGVVLGPGKQVGAVVVQHVVAGGPGEAAGLVVGDEIVSIEGRQVRSVYQAGTLLRKHLPGERIRLTCRSPVSLLETSPNLLAGESGSAEGPGDQRTARFAERHVEVILGTQSDEATTALPADVKQQTIKARFTQPQKIELSNSLRSFEFSLGSSPSFLGEAEARGVAMGQADHAGLDVQLQQYAEAVQSLQQLVDRQREQLTRREQMIRTLESELDRQRKEGPGPAQQQDPP
jgi:S1-C subfamily serine protease